MLSEVFLTDILVLNREKLNLKTKQIIIEMEYKMHHGKIYNLLLETCQKSTVCINTKKEKKKEKSAQTSS